MKAALLAALALAAPALDLAETFVERAERWIGELEALRAAPSPTGAYAYARGLVGLPGETALAPPVDARVYLRALAPEADLRALDGLPPGSYDALGALLAGHAQAHAALGDLAAMEAARASLLAAAERLLAAPPRASDPPVDACGALFLYFGDEPQTLVCDYVVSVSGRGDDVYLNRAGGAAPLEVRLALDLGGNDRYVTNRSAVGGVNGGALSGFGALLDLAGDDVYDAVIYRAGSPFPGYTEGSANGGAKQLFPFPPGVGLLLDVSGADRYHGALGQGGVNGGAGFGGSGALLDLGGAAEAFTGLVAGLSGGVNGGANDGFGLFFHCGSGANVYDGRVQERGGVNGGGEQSVSVFASCGGDGSSFTGYAGGGGVNGGSSGDAQSVFILLEGDSILAGSARYGGVNGGAYLGDAILVAGRGSQRYLGALEGYGGVNGGGILGSGALVDLAGDDVREALSPGTVAANGGGLWGGSGLLVDLGGDDRYDADLGGAAHRDLTVLTPAGEIALSGSARNGEGGTGGCGLLVDLGGRDEYRAARESVWKRDDTSLSAAGLCGFRWDAQAPS